VLTLQGTSIAREGFGGLSGYHAVPTGQIELQLAAKPGAKPLATHATDLTAGRRYTVYAVSQGGKVTLNVLRDAAQGTPAARLRVVHAAPELGKPDLWWAGSKVASAVPYMGTTGYVDAGVGSETLAVAAPGKSSDPIASRTIQLSGGQAMTAFVIGSKGRKVHIVTGHDARIAASKGTYVVRQGDNLWSIAARRLGNGATPQQINAKLHRIWDANAANVPSGDPDLILPGQSLRMA
jgi:nucleoid-associated protein YgaU